MAKSDSTNLTVAHTHPGSYKISLTPLLTLPMSKTTIKSVRGLARALGISHTTVSDALRNSPRVRRETRDRVQKAAREAGYNYNPLAGALMSEMRRSGVGTFRGVISVVDLDSNEVRDPQANHYHGEILKGALEAANRLGFSVDTFCLGKEKVSVSRLGGILQSRGIRGLLVLPAIGPPDLAQLDWDQFAGVYTDYIITTPPLDAVCSDHFRSMFVALHKLHELGYQRPGLVLQEAHDRRLLYRWEAAFRTYLLHNEDFQAISPYVSKRLDKRSFLKWFHETEPDVVLAHRGEILQWMREGGLEVPRTHGFCCLNVMTISEATAGLDLQPRWIGTRAMEALIAQLQRNQYGLPRQASNTTIPAVWKDGPTVRRVAPGRQADVVVESTPI